MNGLRQRLEVVGAVRRIADQRLGQNHLELYGQRGDDLARPAHTWTDGFAGAELVEHGADRENARARIAGPPRALFRGLASLVLGRGGSALPEHGGDVPIAVSVHRDARSEERRVGKEWRAL